MKKILIGYIANTKGSGLDNYIYHLVDILKKEDVQIDVSVQDQGSIWRGEKA